MSGHALCWKLRSVIPRISPWDYEQGDALISEFGEGGGGSKAAKHKVDFSMTTRKENSEVCFQVVNWDKIKNSQIAQTTGNTVF